MSNPLSDLRKELNVDRIEVFYERVPTRKLSKHGELVEGYDHTGKVFAVIWRGNCRYVGISKCHDSDNFVKKVGRDIALKRARFVMENDPDDNGVLVNRYRSSRSRCPGDVQMFYFHFKDNNRVEHDDYLLNVTRANQLRSIENYIASMPEWLYKKIKV